MAELKDATAALKNEVAALKEGKVMLKEEVASLKDANVALKDEMRVLRECLKKTGTLRRETLEAQAHRVKFERIWAAAQGLGKKLDDVLAASAKSVVELSGRRHKLACASRYVRGVVAALPKAPLRNMIYAVGGSDGVGGPLSTVERYDGDFWEAVADLPTATRGHAAAQLRDHVHVIGGSTSTGVTAIHRRYSPNSDLWQEMAPMPTARSCFAAAVLSEQLYVIGGSMDGHAWATVERYDAVAGTWETLANMQTARLFTAVVALDDHIYAIGGLEGAFIGAAVFATVERYDPSAALWHQVAEMPTARYNHAAVAFGGHIYIFGGSDVNDDPLAVAERYSPATGAWEVLPAMPAPRKEGAAVVRGDFIYVLGGEDSDYNASAMVTRYDPATNVWEEVASMLTARESFAAAML